MKRMRTCLRCGHTGEAIDAGGFCNQLVMRDGHGDTCGCECTWDKVTLVDDERDGTLGEVIDQRVQVYGNPVETFARIAEVWSGILGVTVNATDVPLCLIGMKMVRTTQAPDYSDNSDDIEGYLDIFRQLVGPDMIQARSVKEYIEKKQRPLFPGVAGYDRTGGEDEPIPYTIVGLDTDECLKHGQHITTMRHTRDQCPVGALPDEIKPIEVILDGWTPGEDVDDDALVREELEWRRKKMGEP